MVVKGAGAGLGAPWLGSPGKQGRRFAAGGIGWEGVAPNGLGRLWRCDWGFRDCLEIGPTHCHTCTLKHSHTFTCTCTHRHTHLHTHIPAHAYLYTHTITLAHPCAHIHSYTHTGTHHTQPFPACIMLHWVAGTGK